MALSKPVIPRKVYFCVDFEATGQYFMRVDGGSGKDVVFAYGLVVAWWNPDTWRVEILAQRTCYADLGKPDGMPWEEYWPIAGFEPRAWVHFWKDKTALLARLANEARDSVPHAGIAAEFARHKAELEAEFEGDNIHWGTDAQLFEPSICNYLLQVANRPSLMYFDRAGDDGFARFNPAEPVDLDSLLIGKLNIKLSTPNYYDTQYAPSRAIIDQLAETYAPHDHLPLNDAINTACALIYTEQSMGADPDFLRMHLMFRQQQLGIAAQ